MMMTMMVVVVLIVIGREGFWSCGEKVINSRC